LILGFVSKEPKSSALDWNGGGKRVTTFWIWLGLCFDSIGHLNKIKKLKV